MPRLKDIQMALEEAKKRIGLTDSAYVESMINDNLKITDYKEGITTTHTVNVNLLAKEAREKAHKLERETRLQEIKSGKFKVSDKAQKMVYSGYSSHDCEAHYKCPVCKTDYGSWGFGKAGETFKCRMCGATLIYPH